MPDYNPFEFDMSFENWITDPQYTDTGEQLQFGMGEGYTSGAGWYDFQDSNWVTQNLLQGISGSSFLDMWDPQTGSPSGEAMASAFGNYGLGGWAGTFSSSSPMSEYGSYPMSTIFTIGEEFIDDWGALFSAFTDTSPNAGNAMTGSDIGSPWSYQNLANIAGTNIAGDMTAWESAIEGLNTDYGFATENLLHAKDQSQEDMFSERNQRLQSLDRNRASLYETAVPGLQGLKRKAGNTGFVGNARAEREFDLTLEDIQGTLAGYGLQADDASQIYTSQLEELLAEYEFQSGNLETDYNTATSSTNFGYQSNIEGYISDFETAAYDMTSDWFNAFETGLADIQGSTYESTGGTEIQWNLYNPGGG